MGCGKSKQAVATENTIAKSQSKKKEDVAVETNTNQNTTSPNALVEEKGESKKDEVVNKVAESKAVDGGEMTKEEVEGGAKEETKSENGVATNEKAIGDFGASEKSEDVVEEKGLDEEAKMETTKDVVGELVKEKEEEAAVPSIDTETPPAAVAAATPIAAVAATPTAAGEEEKALVSDQEIVPTSPAEEPKTNGSTAEP